MAFFLYNHSLECGLQLMNDLDFKTAVDEIKTAAEWLRETGAPKVDRLYLPQLEHDAWHLLKAQASVLGCN